MITEDTTSEPIGTKALTWALIAGAALLFMEATFSPLVQPRTAAPQTQSVAVAHHERVALR